MTRDHVDDRGWNKEGANTARTAVGELSVCLLNHWQTTDTRANDHAYALSIFLGDLKPAVLHRLHAGSHAVMDKGIHMASFFAGHVILDIEAFDFTSKMRREGTCIETCDGGNTRSASQ